MTDHTLSVTPVDDSTLLTARCACHHWAMVVPDPEIALKLHRCHLTDCRDHDEPGFDAAPAIHVRRSMGRHAINHPAATWWRRHHTG